MFTSSTSGFLEALSKFAACLGAASFAWMTTTPVVIFILMVVRSNAQDSHRQAGSGRMGDFEVLGEEAETDITDLEHANLDGKTRTDRMLVTRYSHLVTGNEMARMNSSQSPGFR